MFKRILITPHKTEVLGDASLLELADILTRVILELAANTETNVPEDKLQDYKEYVYDRFNDIFTAALERYIPDHELRPDLDAEAILAAENANLLRQAEEVTNGKKL